MLICRASDAVTSFYKQRAHSKMGSEILSFLICLFFVAGPGAREATNFKNLILTEMNVCRHMYIYMCCI